MVEHCVYVHVESVEKTQQVSRENAISKEHGYA